jgi:hypothetical protein
VNERSELVTWIRGELVGPSRYLTDPVAVDFHGREFADPSPHRRGPLVWSPVEGEDCEEVLYYDRETPHRKYGAGLLHPAGSVSSDVVAALATDTLGIEPEDNDVSFTGASSEGDDIGGESRREADDSGSNDGEGSGAAADQGDDFEVTSADIRHPSSIGVSFCVDIGTDGRVIVRVPQSRRFEWQPVDGRPFCVNGRYEQCVRKWTDEAGRSKEGPMWRRRPAVLRDTEVAISFGDLETRKVVQRDVPMPDGSPITLRVEVFPRPFEGRDGLWLLTVVLRNVTSALAVKDLRESVLYQSYFEITVERGRLEKYPESHRPLYQLDDEEQSLSLLYREAATWGIGHGCAAGWDAEPGHAPSALYADVMPAVQLPSMTPDIEDGEGRRIELSMRALACLPDVSGGSAWESLEDLVSEYGAWIERERAQVGDLPAHVRSVATRHLDSCASCFSRIGDGLSLLKSNERVRRAFRLANLAMLLQQIATKSLSRRALEWNKSSMCVTPSGSPRTPWDVYTECSEGAAVGNWRAFQIAFLLMSLRGIVDDSSADRETVDLIWFPTGGGKTEAYLAVMAFYMFHERLLMEGQGDLLRRDGTNVLMRYTMRMLTTQQFQRAASLICAMEFLRRELQRHGQGSVPGSRFSLGLWIGKDGSPNTIERARAALRVFIAERRPGGNPFVLTECPWCRAEIGRYGGKRPESVHAANWDRLRIVGIENHPEEGPQLHCSDGTCAFGGEHRRDWLPIEVIDERIYRHPPSLVIATADKLAIVAYRPDSGALFGGPRFDGQGGPQRVPPGLIIQDELHLISGPLGTMYALYEGVFERLCSRRDGDHWIKPKLVASTATIRGAADQVKALYARGRTQLFPSPGLTMGDSFFGRYARGADGKLRDGRLYIGIHASEYGSVLTAQVRAFASALFRPYFFAVERRDPWWTLLLFYNSIRELSGATTLFNSDIRSRMKFLFNREGRAPQQRRRLRIVEELTGRLKHSEIVGMMDRLGAPYSEAEGSQAVDACLASNIIEVGVDIDRLSIMGVVGQPKTTATYIQVTGRVGRRWRERPGLVLAVYNPSKSRDRSHFEQFHSYHSRLYERVEPTSATPFALAAIQRALPGALIAWARQHSSAQVHNAAAYADAVEEGYQLLRQRCIAVQAQEDQERSLLELERVRNELEAKWKSNPQEWEGYPPSWTNDYLMLWPGQFYSLLQKRRGIEVASSMRNVDGTADLSITQGYALGDSRSHH